MSRSSDRRAQTDPLVALVAILAVVAGSGLYMATFSTLPTASPDRNWAGPALERASATLTEGTIVDPSQLNQTLADSVVPSARAVRIVIESENRTWSTEPVTSDGDRDIAARLVPIRIGPDSIRLGRLRVAVWT